MGNDQVRRWQLCFSSWPPMMQLRAQGVAGCEPYSCPDVAVMLLCVQDLGGFEDYVGLQQGAASCAGPRRL